MLLSKTDEMKQALVQVWKNQRKRRIILTCVAVGILVLTIVALWFWGYNYAQNAANAQIEELKNYIYELENTPVVVDPVTPEIVQSVLSSQINEIAELATAEYLFTNAAKFTDTSHIIAIFDWMTEKSFVQKWDGVIKAGVKLDTVSVEIAGNTITIILPPPTILTYEIDYDSVEILDEKNNVFNPISVADKTGFDKETAEAMIQRAISNGLLQQAQKNVENIIQNLLNATLDNGQDYTFKFLYVES